MPLRYEKPNLLAQVTYPARAIGVWYTNNRDRPIMVIVATDNWTTAAGDFALTTGYVTAPAVASAGIDFNAARNALLRLRVNITFVVPAGLNYIVLAAVGGAGLVNLVTWAEILL